MPPRAKRFNAQRFFLTYSQASDVNIDELADFISSLAPCWLEIVQENHVAEGIHYHAVVVFDTRFQQPLTAFDFNDHHPNFAVIKNGTVDLVNYRHYIRKGADRSKEDEHTVKSHRTQACDYIIEPDTRGAVPPYTDETGRLDFGGILNTATTSEEFLTLVRVNQPKEYVLRNDAIIKFAATHYKAARAPEKLYPRDTFVVPPAMDAWVEEVFTDVSLGLDASLHSTLLNRLAPVRFFF